MAAETGILVELKFSEYLDFFFTIVYLTFKKYFKKML